MQIFEHSYEFTNADTLSALLTPFVQTAALSIDDFCIFDIETTGFSPEISSLYLIGCTVLSAGKLHTIQWFANDYVSEKQLLEAFFSYIKNYNVIIHYNGTTFDLPYIQKKCMTYQIDSPLQTKESFDLYYLVKRMRGFLPLNSFKQTSIESFMQIKRNDSFSGGELISVYGDYMKEKYAHHTELQQHLLDKLLLHNHDDIVGLAKCLFILDLFRPLQNNCTPLTMQTTSQQIIISYTTHLTISLNKRIDPYSISLNNGILTFTIPLFHLSLKRFLADYHHYYYLPQEDIAIHESIAEFVDKDFRQKATKQTAYIKTEGDFMPLPIKKGKKNHLDFAYYKNYHDDISYLLLSKQEDEQLKEGHLFCQLLLKRLFFK